MSAHRPSIASSDTSTASILAVVAGRQLRPSTFVLVLGVLTALGPFTMDLYLPAFPAVVADLQTTMAAVQLTLTATAVGLGMGQLLVGPLSDAIGRRLPLLFATGLHIASSVVVALAPGVELVAIARFGQGFGAAAGAVVASAMVRDLFGGLRLVKMAARIALVNGMAPIAAPVIGSQLLAVTDWRGVFWLLAGMGAVALVGAAVFIPETRPRERRIRAGRTAAQRVRTLLRDRVYVGAVFAGAMVFTAIVSYLSASPFIFQDGFGFSEQAFGLLFAANAVGLLLATQLAARLMRRFRPASLLQWALPTLFAVGATLALADVFTTGWVLPAVASAVLVALHGFCGPCLHVLILANHEEQAGTAVALSGFLNCVVGGALSLLPALLGHVGPTSLGIAVASAAAVGALVLWIVVRPSRVPALSRI